MRVLLLSENGDSQLIVTLILIAVSIGLCIVFRNAMGNILNGVITSMKNSFLGLFPVGGDHTNPPCSTGYVYGG